MNVVNTDRYSQGGVPTVFEDRTLFPPPQPVVVDAEYSSKRGGSGAAILIFLLMLVPCGILGYFVYDLSNKVDASTAKDTTAVVAAKDEVIAQRDNEIAALKTENTTLKTSETFYNEGVGRLVAQSGALVAEIQELLDGPKKGAPAIPVPLRTIPVWDTEAKALLESHVKSLEQYKVRVIKWSPPAAPVPEGAIRSGQPDEGQVLPRQ